MDSRCHRKLQDQPDTWCALAVMRLKALRNAGRELTEEEESKLPGCPWAINHQLANYCFFKFAKDYMPDQPMSEIQIAHFNSISVDTVKKTEKTAISKLKEVECFQEISDVFGTDKIMDDSDDLPTEY